MKVTKFLPLTVVSLMAFATVVYIFSDEAGASYPSISNTKGSGTAALAELLKREGFEVRMERSTRPLLAPVEVVVTFVRAEREDGYDPSLSETEEFLIERADRVLRDHLDSGGTQLFIPIDSAFALASTNVATVDATNRKSGETFTVTGDKLFENPAVGIPYLNINVSYATLVSYDEGEPFLTARLSEKGTQYVLHEGLFLTNRFISDEENAALALDVFRRIAPAGATLVFAETRFGNVYDPGLLGIIGGWAKTAGWQALLCLAALIFMVNRRFGLPMADKPPARMTNELLYAFAGTLRRANRADQALLILVESAYNRITSATRAPAGLPPNEIAALAPQSLQHAIIAIRRTYGTKIKHKFAIQLAADLENELSEFEMLNRSRHAPAGQIK